MKKAGFSLIELIFSIVVIGISLGVMPAVIDTSMRASNTAFKSELFYELKYFYGMIKMLPENAKNAHPDISKRNSLLSQYGIPKDNLDNYKNKQDLSFFSLNSRFNPNPVATAGSFVNGLALGDTEYRDNNIQYFNGEIENYNIQFSNSVIDKDNARIILTNKLPKEGNFGGNTKVNQSIHFMKPDGAKWQPVAAVIPHRIVIKNYTADEEDTFKCGKAGENTRECAQKSSFYVFYPDFGREESIFVQYTLRAKGGDAEFAKAISDRLNTITQE